MYNEEQEQINAEIRYYKNIIKLIKTAKKTVMKIPATEMKSKGKIGLNLIIRWDGSYSFSHAPCFSGYTLDSSVIINSKRIIIEYLEKLEFKNENSLSIWSLKMKII